MIDPTCGSGHFLLGGFQRLGDEWIRHEPARNPRDIAQRGLDAVAGVDLNPFAVAISRVRLLVAALKVSRVHRLSEAPNFKLNVAIGDSLLHPDLGIDDAGLLSFTLSNGVYGTLDTSWSRPSSYPIWGDVKLEILGERGVVYADTLHQYVTVASNAAGKTQWAGYGSDMDRGLIADFIDMVRSGRHPSITGEDGLAAMEVALAAYASARSRQPVKLPIS